MKTLYLHGLDSFLTDEKRVILEKYTNNLVAPSIDYRKDPYTIQTLLECYKDEKIELVIGSSMGGLTAYYLSWFWQIPCLAFNPALPYRSTIQELPALPISINNEKNLRQEYLRVILGRHDDVVNPFDTLPILMNDMKESEPLSIHFRNDLAHQIPFSIFDEELNYFFEKVKLGV
ncbi:putative esterase [Bernardetia litoralis DSM 6794]|uniref:Putative esterase n=1 Tax=Bernardetia litoralis (strain ATCC 23117 / DSM 6794 / NBRC 15988 / NCIMB 1366 / Fx l1 / Sio-4) TaxID=880071 RepID=I4AHH5_BERLS|nr:YqiA/YcfP family alpha/beta fold hydrolase [Bernardetia litoralis]AFM03410.1 putative esterase [Bernardetia litoralis DSM 6794]